MFRRWVAMAGVCLAALACGSPGGLTRTDIPPLSGHPPVFDQALVDQDTQRLYVADEALQGVDVFDVSQPDPSFVRSLKLGHPTHGLAVAGDLRKVFVGMDGGAVAVVEANPGAKDAGRLLAVVQTPARKNVDLVDYDSVRHVLWAASSDEGILTRVDAIRNQVLTSLPIAAGLEQPRHNPADGTLYIPNQSANLLYHVDSAGARVLRQWPLGVACSPAGMGVDFARGVAVIGCVDPATAYTLAWNLKTGKRIRTLPDIGDADQVVYDANLDTYMVAGQSGGVTAIAFYRGNPLSIVNLKVTHADTRAVAVNDKTRMVFTPSAKAGAVGLVSFPLPAPEVTAPPYVAPVVYLIPLLLVFVVVWIYGRRQAERRRAAGRPTYS